MKPYGDAFFIFKDESHAGCIIREESYRFPRIIKAKMACVKLSFSIVSTQPDGTLERKSNFGGGDGKQLLLWPWSTFFLHLNISTFSLCLILCVKSHF